MREVRSRDLVNALLQSKEIKVDLEKKIPTSECVLLSHEIIECGGRHVKKIPGHNNRFILYQCEHCPFKVHFIGGGDGVLSLCELVGSHDVSCRASHIVGTSYTSREVASTLLPFVREKVCKGANISGDELRYLLRSVVCGPLHAIGRNFLGKAKKMALESAAGFKEKEQIQYMNSLVSCLQGVGHRAVCLYTTVNEQKEVMKKNARSDYDQEMRMRHTKEEKKFIFDEKMAYEPLNGLDGNRPLLYGYVYSGRYVHKMLPHLKGVFVTDGAHMKGTMKGSILSLWGYDANDHLVNIALCYVLANEDEKRWLDFLNVIRGWYPRLQTTALISDGDKGLAPAIEKVFPAMSHLLCYRHVADNVRKNCGGGT